MFVHDLCDLESVGFKVVANQMIKDIHLNWSREVALIINVVVHSINCYKDPLFQVDYDLVLFLAAFY